MAASLKQQQKVFHELNLLHAVLRARLFELSESIPLHPNQLPLLETVLRFPGITQVEAAARLHVSPASIALSAKRLAAAGMIEKQSDPDSRRCNRLQATMLGERTALQARRNADEAVSRMLNGFTPDELESFTDALTRMLANLSPESGPDCFPFFPEEEPSL